VLTLACASVVAAHPAPPREVNEVSTPPAGQVVALRGATLVDGRGGPALPDAVVVVRGERIAGVGPQGMVPVPEGAEVVEARGLTLLPGLIDAHFHLDGDNGLPGLFLARGVTSLRDPGAWIETYEAVRKAGAPLPRLFLAGPHLDAPPPAYPEDALIVRDPVEARAATGRLIDSGASVIKVYFRLPLAAIAAVTETAHARGCPVTAHLEIVAADDAILAGVDGIEHVTSLGTALLPPLEAERYRQAVLADNAARQQGRYQVWNRVDLDTPRAGALLALMAQRGTVLSPTLAVFERRAGDRDTTEIHLHAFRQMLACVGRARRAGVRIVVGSHSLVPHAERGGAYLRELELLVECGLSPAEVITAATMENARFFRVEDRLGSIEPGKLADLLLVAGDPLKDIADVGRVRRVMLNGKWVRPAEGRPE
jgi:imidazolonepropionase-like amidohydrolase